MIDAFFEAHVQKFTKHILSILDNVSHTAYDEHNYDTLFKLLLIDKDLLFLLITTHMENFVLINSLVVVIGNLGGDVLSQTQIKID